MPVNLNEDWNICLVNRRKNKVLFSAVNQISISHLSRRKTKCPQLSKNQWVSELCFGHNSSLRVLNWLILFYSPSVCTGVCWDFSQLLLDLTASVGFVFPVQKLCDFPLVQLDFSLRKLGNHQSENPNWKSCPAHKPLPFSDLSFLCWSGTFPVNLFLIAWKGSQTNCRGTGVEENSVHQLTQNPL